MKFQYINEQLLMPRIRELLSEWLPGGQVKGKEYRCANLCGGKGESFGCNIDTGRWSDFATGEKGGDLISLYAVIRGIGNKAAAKLLVETLGGTQLTASKPDITKKKPKVKVEFDLITPPSDVDPPDFNHYKFGEPAIVYDYRDIEGNLVHYLARYEPKDGRKQFIPYSWGSDGKWHKKAYPEPRPLYGLSQLTGKPLLVVEGEKAWLAAFDYFEGDYDVLTWSGGANGWKKSWLGPLFEAKKIIFWPDADTPGRKAMKEILGKVVKENPSCEAIYINAVGEDGLDVADLHSDGLDRAGVIKWMKERMEVIKAEPVKASNLKKEAKTFKNEQPAPKPKKPAVPNNINKVFIDCKLELDNSGRPIPNQSNVNLLLKNHPPFKDIVWYDEFHDCLMTRWRDDEQYAWEKADTLELLRLLQADYGFRKLIKSVVQDAVDLQASYVTRNEAKDWMNSLKWDDVGRIDTFLIDYCGAEDNEYVRAVTKNFFIAMAARVLEPGCKFDYLLILEGEQNIAKSRLLDVLGGKFYGVPNEKIKDKDFIQVTRGKFLLELPELEAFEGKSNNIKKMLLSTREDLVRTQFATRHEPKPRSFVWAGTTNKEDYLDDETGDRRYWPVKIKHVLIDDVKDVRDQLFAEAVARYKLGETYWEVPESAKDEQAARQHDDLWTEPIRKYLDNAVEIKDLSVVLEHVGVDLGKQTKSHANRMAKIMRKLGWHNTPQYIDGKSIRKWRPRCVTYATNGHGGTISDMVTKNQNGKRLVKNHATGEMIEY